MITAGVRSPLMMRCTSPFVHPINRPNSVSVVGCVFNRFVKSAETLAFNRFRASLLARTRCEAVIKDRRLSYQFLVRPGLFKTCSPHTPPSVQSTIETLAERKRLVNASIGMLFQDGCGQFVAVRETAAKEYPAATKHR